ncbi:M48 family metallopeptidase [Tsuneonella sp. HG094]
MSVLDILAATVANPGFDVETATRAYLDTLQGPARAQSDAYFEGGYWLTLWSTLIAVLVDGLLLKFRVVAAFRDFGERRFKRRFLVVGLTALLYTLVGTIITLPWTIYTAFFREKQYGLMSQTFGEWASEQAIALGISLVIAPLAMIAIYAVIRRAPRMWWLWGTGLVGLFALFGAAIAPVYIAPLFNTYAELERGPLRTKIEAVAAKYAIPAEHIYVFDASKQTKRISANVSGLGPTIRISLNDNLLNRTSEPEILAVMGHEMGHYVLNHVWRNVLWMLVIFGLGFFLTSRIAPRLIARYGERWGVRELADPASLPVLAICLSLYMLVATPAIKTMIRTAESEADAFGLDAAQQPDGFAMTAMRLSEYRKIEPSSLEEFLFYDHPSGATRVRMAMQWKKDHLPDAQVVTPPAGYLDDK